jgi:hypothetical protein
MNLSARPYVHHQQQLIPHQLFTIALSTDGLTSCSQHASFTVNFVLAQTASLLLGF